MRIALVGCGAKKQENRCRAADLYTSTYFKLKREYAQENCSDWRILSAKFGVLEPDTVVSPYDTRIDDVDTDEWSDKVILGLKHLFRENSGHEVVVLAGEDYVEPIRGFLEREVNVIYPFADTSGIGEQMALLKEGIQE